MCTTKFPKTLGIQDIQNFRKLLKNKGWNF